MKLSTWNSGVGKTSALGYVVSRVGFRSSDKHVTVFESWCGPAFGDKLLKYLGVITFFSGFVDYISKTSAFLLRRAQKSPTDKKEARTENNHSR